MKEQIQVILDSFIGEDNETAEQAIHEVFVSKLRALMEEDDKEEKEDEKEDEDEDDESDEDEEKEEKKSKK